MSAIDDVQKQAEAAALAKLADLDTLLMVPIGYEVMPCMEGLPAISDLPEPPQIPAE